MHVAVLGAGVVGMTTAYYLVESGHSVTVIDREKCVAEAASHANGAQLCYSFVDAMASPSFAMRIPGLIAGLDPAILVRPSMSLSFLKWGVEFLTHCTTDKSEINTVSNLRLALRSAKLLEELREKVPGDFSHRSSGKLVLLGTDQQMENAFRSAELKARHECVVNVISLDEAIDIEPAIEHMTGSYSGAIYSPDDEVGDAREFSMVLEKYLRESGRCEFQLETSIQSIVSEKNKVRSVRTSRGEIDVDATVISLGVWSANLLKPFGIDPGIYPSRGYSVTLPKGKQTPKIAVTDYGARFVISHIDSGVRVAGFADFVGLSTKADSRRIDALLQVGSRNAPLAADYNAADNNAWGGFRPLTASGCPRTEASKVKGLFLNTGHGSLGWTLACASGDKVAKLVTQSA